MILALHSLWRSTRAEVSRSKIEGINNENSHRFKNLQIGSSGNSIENAIFGARMILRIK
jgi:hypothetical protein